MKVINYFKSFKDFIPTWVICIFMFVGVFIWPLVIGIILLIIQNIQRSKIITRIYLLDKIQQTTISDNSLKSMSLENNFVKEAVEKSEKNHSEISSLQMQLKQTKELLFEKQNNIKISEKENNRLKQELSRLYDEIRIQNEKIEKLSSRNNVTNQEAQNIICSDRFILCAGKYKGGMDIPIGIYNLKVLSGQGGIKVNKPEEIYENISSNPNHGYGFLNEYRNMEISDKSILKISESAKVQFTLSKRYDFSQEIGNAKQEYENRIKELEFEYKQKYKAVQTEINTIRSELRALNNKAISKYYIFSDYDSTSSQDCKNKLSILKIKEKELRDSGEDIKTLNNFEEKKLIERSIRQLLRNFNSECDNIISHIKTKNVDLVRTRIQKSYETLNKLYYVDGVALSDKILSLKLEQATLLYTYELKYQQEKDIQQAIKEQMMEEAKAEREIQEQKKKIEKDLQQHMSEIKRIMKYMQSSQIDAERQLYLDKIKELEEKVKLLESDKETVLEREANAKAGFVYIISNIGSFGEDIYKIGMTRRLEPMDRVKELSSASVPFEFDVHAMIFSSDAPAVETMLHKHFEKHAVNKVNPRKEFYHVDIDEIEKVVLEEYNNTVQFTKIPLATEYRQSLAMQDKATG